jgi:uncharacterized membrane protein
MASGGLSSAVHATTADCRPPLASLKHREPAARKQGRLAPRARRRRLLMATSITVTVPSSSADTQLLPAKVRAERLESVDLLRGVVMVIMALDHVRDFFSERLLDTPTDLSTTTAGIFLTRWITHFCAPAFIFLAGTSAFLSATRGKARPALSWFLFTRGLWLAFFEVVINRMLWMFNFDLHHHGAGVFWAIGWSMIVLSVLVYLPAWVVAVFGIAIIAAHNLLDNLTAADVHLPRWVWMILHVPGDETVVDGITFGTSYCLIPWIGVMAAGYGFGWFFQFYPHRRRQWFILLGAAVTLAFVLLRAANVYGDPQPWVYQSTPLWTFFSFLNCTKYPASLLYVLMTLGPAIIFLGLFDRPLGPWARPLLIFGRVPLFYYLLHIPLIHVAAVLVDYARFGRSPLAANGPWFKPEEMPPGYGVSLPVVYLIWIGVVLVLYFPCRWFAEVKRRHRDGWLSYL